MKRTSLLLIPILLIALLLCSCNADAQDGIFSAIADSAPDAGIKVHAYLGNIGNAHYVLTDTGVYGINAPSFSPIKNSEGIHNIEACIINNDIYVRSTSSSGENKISKYSKEGIKDASFTEIPNVKKLLVNGAYYTYGDTKDKQTIHFLTSGATSTPHFSTTETINTMIESENYVFVELSDKSYAIFNSKTGTTIFESPKDTLKSLSVKGFQAIDDSHFLIVSSSYDIYTIDESGLSSSAVASLKSTPPNGNISSFHYKTEDGKDIVVFKMHNYFDGLTANETEYKIEPISTAGYATKLRTASVSNIVPADTAGKFIIATWKNSIWEIDPTSTNDPVEIR